MIEKNIEIITLVYRSVEYLHFIVDQLRSPACQAEGWTVGIRVVANDATPEVLEALACAEVNYTVYNDPQPNAYYINRVYRAYNFGGRTSTYDNICFVNSDCAFSEGWLANLLKHHDGVNLPCSMFFESGKMPSGWPGMTKDFGRHPGEFRREKWEEFAKVMAEPDEVIEGGLYMPYPMQTKRFVESGGYPEGNIYHDGVGTLGNFVMSGDQAFFHRLYEEFGMRHFTVMDSIFYHIQEGEKDAKR